MYYTEPVIVHLLPEFACSLNESETVVSGIAGRLVIQLALQGGALPRKVTEAEIWPDLEPARAAKRLSQLVWRIRCVTGDTLIEVHGDRLCLPQDLSVDYWAAEALARYVLDADQERLSEVDPLVIRLLSTELLRGVTDDRVLRERDHWDRLRVLALEKLAATALHAGDALNAIEVAMAAVDVDGLAEGPNRVLASAYLIQGDTISARRIYLRYAADVRQSLGTDPSPNFRALIASGEDQRIPAAERSQRVFGELLRPFKHVEPDI